MNTDTKKAHDMKTSTHEGESDKKMDTRNDDKKLDDKAPMEKREDSSAK